MVKRFFLFDLDGTITDPAEGITNSVAYALRKFNISVADKSTLQKFIGPPLWESFGRYFGFTTEQAESAVGYYREYYKDKGIYENFVYNGIEELLRLLKSEGKTLIIATSKPTVFAEQVLNHFDLGKYFDFVAGSELDGTRVKKDEVIAYAVEKCNIRDLSKAVMIGDREHDILGAKKHGITSVGVLHGYGGEEELTAAGADYIAKDVAAIAHLLTQF